MMLRRFFPCILADTLAVYLWKEKMKQSLRKLIPILMVTVAWIIVYNSTAYLSNYHQAVNINNFKDILFGTYFFAAVIIGEILLQYSCEPSIIKYGNIIFSAVVGLTALIPLFHIGYYFLFGQVFSVSAGIAIFQTNYREVFEFIQQNILGLGSIFFLCICIFIGITRTQVKYFKALMGFPTCHFTKKELTFICIIDCMIIGYLPVVFSGTGIGEPIKSAHGYFKEASKFNKWHDKNFDSLTVTLPSKKFTNPSTIIVVIGESASRNFMSSYGYTVHDTTPWLKNSVEKDSSHFLQFNHAYASYGVTVQSLERALTEKNQYNDIHFANAFTIIDLAKKAGYTTYWFSNQSIHNSAETPIALVAKTTKYHQWIDDIPGNDHKVLYDGDLLPCLKKINPTENNFVVIHIMGSHELTRHRYPENFAKFSKAGEFDLVANYEDSMAYTDWLLREIFTYGKKNLNLQAMIYFSDHGANPYRKRVPTHSPFSNLRIPLVIYLADEYQTLYPETTGNLKNHINNYFTNDLLYETIGGILNLKSIHIDEENNLAGFQYKWIRETLKTNLGENSLNEDIHENDIDYGKY